MARVRDEGFIQHSIVGHYVIDETKPIGGDDGDDKDDDDDDDDGAESWVKIRPSE
jgi:hypothetical protein